LDHPNLPQNKSSILGTKIPLDKPKRLGYCLAMTTHQIEQALERQQQIQMTNPPTSEAWLKASAEIHRLAELLTGKPAQEARG
jgi:hypothetical protein